MDHTAITVESVITNKMGHLKWRGHGGVRDGQDGQSEHARGQLQSRDGGGGQAQVSQDGEHGRHRQVCHCQQGVQPRGEGHGGGGGEGQV